MTIHQWDVVVAEIHYGHSDDVRPCIVVELPAPDGSVCVIPLSSHLALSQEWRDFRFDPNHPDFVDTGLARASFANGAEIYRIHRPVLKRIGSLRGELLRAFRDWLE
jgi:hypothetical protein